MSVESDHDRIRVDADRQKQDIERATRRIGEKAMGISFPDDYWDGVWAFYEGDPDIRDCMAIHDWHLQAIAQIAGADARATAAGNRVS